MRFRAAVAAAAVTLALAGATQAADFSLDSNTWGGSLASAPKGKTMIRPAGLPGGDGANADCAGAVHAAWPVGSRLPSDTGQFGPTRSTAIL